VHRKDELLTTPVPGIHLILLSGVLLRQKLVDSRTAFQMVFSLLQYFVYGGITGAVIVPQVVDFYLGKDLKNIKQSHQNDLLFEIQTGFAIILGLYWILKELFWFIMLLGVVALFGIHWLRENNKALYDWIKAEDWLWKLYNHFEDARLTRRERECVICMENTVDTVLVPCGHICSCMMCSTRMSPITCPICKGPVQKVIRTYDATFKTE